MTTTREEQRDVACDTACENTDRHLWPITSPAGEHADSIHVTKDGGIGINVGGQVIVLPLREWHALALRASRAGGVPAEDEMVRISRAELCRLNQRECDLQNVLRWALYKEPNGNDLVNRLTTFAIEQRGKTP